MSFDFEDVAASLATVFGGVTSPAVLEPLAYVTHQLPENITELPCGLVFPFTPTTYEYDPRRRNGGFVWPVRFFFPMWSLPQRISNMYQWLQVLYAQFPVASNIDLGLGSYVYYAEIVSSAITTFDYGRNESSQPINWPVIEIHVLTQLGEALS